MSYIHFNAEERSRVNALMRENGVTEYAVLRQLITLGFQRLDAGEKLFGSGPVMPVEEVNKRLEKRLNLILEKLHHIRGRQLNMTLELVEHTMWLRALGEILAPGERYKVDSEARSAAQLLLKNLHLPPPSARQAQ